MERIAAIWDRRSVRRFTADPVPFEMVEMILDAGTRAPTGGNVQPWEFMLIEAPELRKQVVQETYAGYYSGPGNPQLWILEAPVLIVVLCNFKRTLARYGEDAYKWAPLDVAAATQNIILSATQLGLGSCWIGGFRDEAVSELLGLPRLVRPIGLLPVGWPAEEKPRKPRLPLRQLVHRDRYGTALYKEE
jgi:nitroreductase